MRIIVFGLVLIKVFLVLNSSLSSVQPPDIWYRLSLPEEVIQNGWLSALQLEAVVYACQQHEQLLADGSRAGFLIGLSYNFLQSLYSNTKYIKRYTCTVIRLLYNVLSQAFIGQKSTLQDGLLYVSLIQ